MVGRGPSFQIPGGGGRAPWGRSSGKAGRVCPGHPAQHFSLPLPSGFRSQATPSPVHSPHHPHFVTSMLTWLLRTTRVSSPFSLFVPLKIIHRTQAVWPVCNWGTRWGWGGGEKRMPSGILETARRGLQLSGPFVAGRETDKVMAKTHQNLRTPRSRRARETPG